MDATWHRFGNAVAMQLGNAEGKGREGKEKEKEKGNAKGISACADQLALKKT